MLINKILPNEIQNTAEALFMAMDFPEECQLSVLIDHSLAPNTPLLDAWPGGRPRTSNLLAELGGADERISLLLLELPFNREKQSNFVTYLLRKCNGLPMFSILASPLSFADLSAHLSLFTQVCLPPDGQGYLLRFGDTRVAPTIARLLTFEQRARMFGPILQWAFLDREGRWGNIPGDGSTTGAEGPLFELSEAQLDAFVRATMPDNFIAQLREEFAGFAGIEPSSQYRLVCHWIEQVNEAAGGQAESGQCLAYCKERLTA